MAWVEDLAGKVVGLDTAPFIYSIEEHPKYLLVLQPFFEALDRGQFQVVASTLTLLEVVVQPLRNGDLALAELYRTILLDAAGLTTMPITASISEAAASLRAALNLATPGALQVTAMIQGGASVILTNDLALKGVTTVEVITFDELAASHVE